MKLMHAIAALAASLAGPAMAAVTVINFDTLASNDGINQYYNGGASTFGMTGGGLGVGFSNFRAGTSTLAPSQPNYAYLNGGTGMINVPSGFSAFNMLYVALKPTTISVFSLPNGGGTLLGSIGLPAGPAAFAALALPFVGVGESVKFTGTPYYFALDNVQIAPAWPVPEPSSWAMLAGGLGVLGLVSRRRRAV